MKSFDKKILKSSSMFVVYDWADGDSKLRCNQEMQSVLIPEALKV